MTAKANCQCSLPPESLTHDVYKESSRALVLQHTQLGLPNVAASAGWTGKSAETNAAAASLAAAMPCEGSSSLPAASCTLRCAVSAMSDRPGLKASLTDSAASAKQNSTVQLSAQCSSFNKQCASAVFAASRQATTFSGFEPNCQTGFVASPAH